jgi:hypothetical protein
MTESQTWSHDSTPKVAVRVYDHGALIETVLCDSEGEAAVVVERWTERVGFTCQVDDVAEYANPDDALEPDLDAWDDAPG